MRKLAIAALAGLIAAPAIVGPAGPVKAQGWFGGYEAPRERVYRERRYEAPDDANFQRRMRYYSRDAVARRNAERRVRDQAGPEEREPNFFERLFGGRPEREERGWRDRADPGAVEVRPPARRPRRRPPPAMEARPAPPAMAAPGVAAGAAVAALPPGDPAALQPVPAAPVTPTTFVAVIGDSVADGLATGLQDGFADTPELAVRRVTKPNTGLVRDDYFDFVAEARKALDAGPVTYAVVEVGVNDRQPFLDMRKEPPLSDEWKKRYLARIDALLALFKERKTPVYWVGLAPSESRRATTDHIALNALAKERVEAAGGTYVDVWEGFVDEDGVYAESGPLLDGQIGRLRLDDGVHFSKGGARKLAHYVEQEIRKVFQPKTPSPDPAVAAVDPEVGPQPATPGPAAEQPRPISSPVVVLTGQRRAPGGALAAASPVVVPARDASVSAARVLVNGEAPDADPGRMDDYRWPGAEPPARAASAPAKIGEDAPKPVAVAPTDRPDAKVSEPRAPGALFDPRPTAEQSPR